MTDRYNKVVAVRLDDDLYEKLENYAEKEMRSLSSTIRYLLFQSIRNQQQ